MTPILNLVMTFVGTNAAKRLIVSIARKLVERTDNTIDDDLVDLIGQWLDNRTV